MEKRFHYVLFEEIFLKYGGSVRENQIELSLEMLESIIENKVALCEAEVGIGKTYAYILAVVVYKMVYKDLISAIISTSTIDLHMVVTK